MSPVGLGEHAAIWYQIQPADSADSVTVASQSSLEQSPRTAQGVRKKKEFNSSYLLSGIHFPAIAVVNKDTLAHVHTQHSGTLYYGHYWDRTKCPDVLISEVYVLLCSWDNRSRVLIRCPY